MCFQCGLFDLVDCFAAKEVTADGDEIWAYGAFGLIMHMEILLEVCFFDREGFMGWILVHFVILKQFKHDCQNMFDHLSEEVFDAACQVECHS